ncbi:TetR/AcrR family transcriptional regulator [Sedimentibacter sp. MB31-C6]|uniref:TetR/AcrR family transcriptional regulator n=1 Tax=Sedimentibacter sp. MB31-C6 TaxID=3109366 RepID=UPI002DDD57A8|nr:TetR/AcrR family transcriptional regulator [Sedimentibacter sp. MB36-C1]WSI03229.1 TetR/AcrR family transcriptional regulator [Sedimentibacter sp. MB36-C1]
MATAFSDNEKELIIKKLDEISQECLLKYGVKKTTVDQIVKMAGISKGSFYNFYSSKEILFFKVLEEYQKSIISELVSKLKTEDNIGVDKFTEMIYELYQNVRQSFIMNIIQNQEFEYLIRKLPKELLINHHSLDDLFSNKIFSNIKSKDDINMNVVTASLRAIFLSMIHVEEVGEKDFDEVLKFLIKGVAKQIIMEDFTND